MVYISEFWCGVAATIVVEITALVALAFWQERKNKR